MKATPTRSTLWPPGRSAPHAGSSCTPSGRYRRNQMGASRDHDQKPGSPEGLENLQSDTMTGREETIASGGAPNHSVKFSLAAHMCPRS